MVVVDHTIFSFGGRLDYTTFHGTDAIYKYDLATNTWALISNMIQPRYFASAIRLSETEILITGKSFL